MGQINQFKDLSDWKAQFANEDFNGYWVIDLQTNRLESKPNQSIKDFKFNLQTPRRKDHCKDKYDQDEYEGACSDHYVQGWVYGYLKQGDILPDRR